MKILICDDEPQFIKILVKYLRQYELETRDDYSIYTYQRADSMIEAVKQMSDIDIIFLDVVLTNENGVEKAKVIREFNQRIKIIFVSSYIEFAVEGYDVDAAGYILKPLDYQSFKNRIARIFEKVHNENASHFWDKTDKGNILFELSDILYIETYGRNVRIHSKNNIYTTYHKMKHYESLLREHNFFRCHAAYIVNMQAIRRIDGMKVFLKDDSIVMISRARKKEFMQTFLRYVERKIPV